MIENCTNVSIVLVFGNIRESAKAVSKHNRQSMPAVSQKQRASPSVVTWPWP